MRQIKETMKKLFLVLALVAVGTWSTQVKAQKKQGLFNRLAVGVSASTMGIGIDASTTLNRHFMLRAGVDIMPNFTFKTDVDVDVESASSGLSESTVDLEGGLKRTQFSLLLNVYPFKKSNFFITGGAYFGGEKLIKIKGYSPELKELYDDFGEDAGIIIGDYKLPIDKNGNVSGGMKVSGFRPYVGIGHGRAVPHKRLGFMFEVGVQFHKTPKLYSDTGDISDLLNKANADDDFSEILDKLNIYPVIKFRLCGRIF